MKINDLKRDMKIIFEIPNLWDSTYGTVEENNGKYIKIRCGGLYPLCANILAERFRRVFTEKGWEEINKHDNN